MIDGFELARDLLEDLAPCAPRAIATMLAAQGSTVEQIAADLGVSPMTAWWLTGFTAVRSADVVAAVAA